MKGIVEALLSPPKSECLRLELDQRRRANTDFSEALEKSFSHDIRLGQLRPRVELLPLQVLEMLVRGWEAGRPALQLFALNLETGLGAPPLVGQIDDRSEERRVGKECR